MTPQSSPALSGLARAVRRGEAFVAIVSKAALWLGAALLCALLAIIAYSVMMRYFAGRPQPWVDEAAGWLLVGSVMLSVPEVQRRGDHIGIDFMFAKVGARWRGALVAFSLLTVLASAAIFMREGLAMVEFSRTINVLSNQIPEIPLWAVQAFVPLGFAVMLLVVCGQLLCVALGLPPRDMSESLKSEAE